MTVVPLAVHSPRAVEDALRAHGWDAGLARDAAGGIHPAAFLLSALQPATLEALVLHGGKLGLNVVTGDDWAVVAGSQARLSALARPWVVPDSLRDVAVELGMALPAEQSVAWRTARGALSLTEPVLMGILNVTPDSFSDGGRFAGPEAAVAHAVELAAGGAAIIDVGGESTRPGRTAPVAPADELARVIPVIAALAREAPAVLISVDTVKAEVARAAIDAGAAIVNDVSGLRLDDAMAAVVARAGAGVVVMHSRGGILDIASYVHAQYPAGVIAGVLDDLRQSLARAVSAGVGADAIVIDPGFGFSKTVPQNMLLLDELASLRVLGHPVLIGPSRKRFLAGQLDDSPAARDVRSATACAVGWERGARLFRVHDVRAAREALALVRSLDPS